MGIHKNYKTFKNDYRAKSYRQQHLFYTQLLIHLKKDFIESQAKHSNNETHKDIEAGFFHNCSSRI